MSDLRISSISPGAARIIREGHEYCDKLRRGEIKPEEIKAGQEGTEQNEKTYEEMTDVERFNRWGIKGLRLDSEAINM